MKKTFLFFLLSVLFHYGFSQDTYLQIKGESDLSVYVNGVFKCKTTAELKGCIIEGITPGSNLIKVEKKGYAPYEETVTIKKGEVFAYTVKPFKKHVVTISQEGSTAQTEKKVALETGKLVIQSVPIEISISIPKIEGVSNMPKTKDQWIAEKIPAGSYPVTFSFNGKTITKTVEVDEDNTTSVFINMLSGEFKSKSTLDEKKAKKLEMDKMKSYVEALLKNYHFKRGLSRYDFINQCSGCKVLTNYEDRYNPMAYKIPSKTLMKSPELTPGYTYLSVNDDKNAKLYKTVTVLTYTLVYTKDYSIAKAKFQELQDEFKQYITNKAYLYEAKDYISIRSFLTGVDVTLAIKAEDKGGYRLDLRFQNIGI